MSDHFSRFLKIFHIPTAIALTGYLKAKGWFCKVSLSRWGCVWQWASILMWGVYGVSREFSFQHITLSPHNTQGNGHAERGVQTAKRILKQKDPLLTLMCFRSTPCTATVVSPAELLMGRKIKTTLSIFEANLQPQWPDLEIIRNKDAMDKLKEAFYFNEHHGAKPPTIVEARWSHPHEAGPSEILGNTCCHHWRKNHSTLLCHRNAPGSNTEMQPPSRAICPCPSWSHTLYSFRWTAAWSSYSAAWPYSQHCLTDPQCTTTRHTEWTVTYQV